MDTGLRKSKGFETGRLAKDRLKIVLINDRIESSAQVMEMLKADMVNAVSNYMEIEEGFMEIQIGQALSEDKESVIPVLSASIPIKNVKKMA